MAWLPAPLPEADLQLKTAGLEASTGLDMPAICARYVCATYTQERHDWALELTKGHCPLGSTPELLAELRNPESTRPSRGATSWRALYHRFARAIDVLQGF